MKRDTGKKRIRTIILVWIISSFTSANVMSKIAKRESCSAELMEPIEQRKQGLYEKYIKRCLDILCASTVVVVLAPLYIILAILVHKRLGSPVLFIQERPGRINSSGKEEIFKMYKFRTMTDAKGENGELLPDEKRLTSFGKKLRATSLDELPEVINILNGTMSVVGPRPQLVQDLVFMSKQQRKRHTARPGLSGLAQIKGRNAISWEKKINWDLKYVESISLINDIRIIALTFSKVFLRRDITESNSEIDITLDYGDELLEKGTVSREDYNQLKNKAASMLRKK